jgi:hypothetical protein
VTKDYAVVIAQVLPVLALAVGIEVRTITFLKTASRSSWKRSVNVSINSAIFFGLLTVQIVLLDLELDALSVVSGAPIPYPDYAPMRVALAVAFLFPFFTVGIRIVREWLASYEREPDPT